MEPICIRLLTACRTCEHPASRHTAKPTVVFFWGVEVFDALFAFGHGKCSLNCMSSMRGRFRVAVATAIVLLWAAYAAPSTTTNRITQAIENRSDKGLVSPGAAEARVVRAQILLDRARFSPGQIDGHYGGDLGIA